MALSETLLSPLDRVIKAQGLAHLGAGLIRPFQRDGKSDFANTAGVALVQASIGQILTTQASSDFAQGELPWRPEFGSLLHTLWHSRNDEALAEVAKAYVVDALTRWEPRIRLKDVVISRAVSSGKTDNILSIKLRYDVVSGNVSGNDVFVPGVIQTVTVGY